jgi:hypothetical protein
LEKLRLGRDLVPDETTLGLGPNDFLRLDPEDCRLLLVSQQRRGMIVVDQLEQAVQNLVDEIPWPELGDDLLFDAVENLGQSLILTEAELFAQKRCESVESPACPHREVFLPPCCTYDPDQSIVDAERGEQNVPRDRRTFESGKGFQKISVAELLFAVEVHFVQTAVVSQTAIQPRGVGLEIQPNRSQEMAADFVNLAEPTHVVLERPREGGTRCGT